MAPIQRVSVPGVTLCLCTRSTPTPDRPLLTFVTRQRHPHQILVQRPERHGPAQPAARPRRPEVEPGVWDILQHCYQVHIGCPLNTESKSRGAEAVVGCGSLLLCTLIGEN
jgi:hypothetical protein